MTAREVLDGIKERAAIPPESFNFIQQAAHENQLLKVDLPRLTRAVEAVLELHRPAKIYDECECPDGTHPEDYDYIDCEDYVGCHNSITGIGCDECCVDGDYLSQACGESHSHTLNAETRCPTVAAIENALNP